MITPPSQQTTKIGKPSHKDLSAGITLTLIAIPQCLAYALLAGIPPIYGLVTAAVPGLLAALLGKSPNVTVGPTNTTGLLILTALTPIISSNPDQLLVAMATLTLLSGLVRLFIVWLRIERMFDFIPEAVITGFATGAAIMIIAMQLDEALGVEVSGISTFAGEIYQLSSLSWPSFEIWGSNLFFAVFTIISILLARKFIPSIPFPLLWILAAITFVAFNLPGSSNLITLGKYSTMGWPEFSLPILEWEMIKSLILPAIAIAFVGSLELVVILRRTGTEELFRDEIKSQGFANLGGSFVGSFSASTSLTRSILLTDLGATTRWAAAFSALFMIPVLWFGGQFIGYIPETVIAAMLMLTAWSMLNGKMIKQMLAGNSETRILFISTFFATLTLNFHEAILIGAIIAMVMFLLSASQPKLLWLSVSNKPHPKSDEANNLYPAEGCYLLQISGSLFYAAAKQLPNQVFQSAPSDTQKLIISLEHSHQIRFSGIQALKQIVNHFGKENVQIILPPESMVHLCEVSQTDLPFNFELSTEVNLSLKLKPETKIES